MKIKIKIEETIKDQKKYSGKDLFDKFTPNGFYENVDERINSFFVVVWNGLIFFVEKESDFCCLLNKETWKNHLFKKSDTIKSFNLLINTDSEKT